MKRADIPNIITIARIILVIPILLALMWQSYTLAFWLFVIAGVSDAVDGFLARRFHWMSRLGGVLDPLADKALLLISFITLGFLGHMPVWLVVMVVVRDIVIVSGGFAYHFLIGEYDFKPTWISKVNTFLQIFLLALTLLQLSYYVLPAHWLEWLMVLVFITSLVSMLDYVVVWGCKAIKSRRQQASDKQGEPRE
ncbi:MAG: CDP-alcohol phosphatidyltransferase [Legionellales bacterium]|nr:CDP-alcohol phosphatidyltransferase [Legionellales bacterium]|tara:strand:- start:28145 stop:28729 length:585 start_codon:yes stop_codon:yes gene_type:complete